MRNTLQCQKFNESARFGTQLALNRHQRKPFESLHFFQKSAKVPINVTRAHGSKNIHTHKRADQTHRNAFGKLFFSRARKQSIGTLALFFKKYNKNIKLQKCRLSAD
jgi:hypothetical protein